MKKKMCSIGFVFLAACASHPAIVPAGEGTYIASRSGQVFTTITELKAKALMEADGFCSAKRQTFKVLNSTNSEPPYILGNFPRVEITFKCISEGA